MYWKHYQIWQVRLINQVFCFCRRWAIFVFWRFMNFLTWFTKCMSNTLCEWTFRWIVVELIFCVSWTSFDLLVFHLICQVCLEMKILIFLFRTSRPSVSIPIVNQGRAIFLYLAYSLQNIVLICWNFVMKTKKIKIHTWKFSIPIDVLPNIYFLLSKIRKTWKLLVKLKCFWFTSKPSPTKKKTCLRM